MILILQFYFNKTKTASVLGCCRGESRSNWERERGGGGGGEGERETDRQTEGELGPWTASVIAQLSNGTKSPKMAPDTLKCIRRAWLNEPHPKTEHGSLKWRGDYNSNSNISDSNKNTIEKKVRERSVHTFKSSLDNKRWELQTANGEKRERKRERGGGGGGGRRRRRRGTLRRRRTVHPYWLGAEAHGEQCPAVVRGEQHLLPIISLLDVGCITELHNRPPRQSLHLTECERSVTRDK